MQSGGQEAVVTGPTVAAANSAANAQITATQLATQAARESTQSAIAAITGQYQESVALLTPSINTGNQAAAQMNYMLGLPAVNPGNAPTAPQVTQSDVAAYVNANTTELLGGAGGFGAGNVYDLYTGIGAYGADDHPQTQANQATGNPGQVGNLAVVGGQTMTGLGLLGPGQYNQIQSAIQADPTLSDTYNNQMTAYNEQLATYNSAESLYNTYKAKGTASAEDINNLVTNLPGYQSDMTSGINAIQNASSASGMLNSSNILQGLDTFGQSLTGQYYQNYMSNLGTLANLGANATGAAVQSTNTLGSNIANAETNLGTNVANSFLAAGQAEASSFTSPAANQQVIGTQVGGGSSNVGGILSGIGSIAGLFSSYSYKDKITNVNFKHALDNLDALPVDMWKYKGTDQAHIGAYAEDFQEMFKVGDGKTINIIDAFGACFGLIKELKKEIDSLRSQL